MRYPARTLQGGGNITREELVHFTETLKKTTVKRETSFHQHSGSGSDGHHPQQHIFELISQTSCRTVSDTDK